MPFSGLQRRIFDNAIRETGGTPTTRPIWETDPTQYPIKSLPWGLYLDATDNTQFTLSGSYVVNWTSGVVSPVNASAGAIVFNNQGSTTTSPAVSTATPPPMGVQYLEFDGVNDFLTTGSISTTPQFRGVNVAAYGARGYWGNWSGANTAGSTYAARAGNGPQVGVDFGGTYATSKIDYLISKGMNFFRVLVNHEALQPEPSAAIPYAGSFTNASRYVTYYNAVKTLVDYIIGQGCTVLLDFHNAENGMACYYNMPIRVGATTGQVDASVLADAWGKLATIFNVANNAAYSRVWFGLHNEPNGSDVGAYTVTTWFAVAQACITAIRGASNTNKILVPGLDFTASRSFVYNGSAAKFLTLTDSANNLGVQVHLYFDANNGGGGSTIAHTNPDYGITFGSNQSYNPKDTNADGSAASTSQIGSARMIDLTSWAETNHVEVYVTEYAVSTLNESNADQTTLATNAINDFFAFIDQHPVYVKGVAWWESGYAPGHFFTIDEYSAGVPSPMLALIQSHMVSSLPIPTAPPAFNPYAATASNGRLEDLFLVYDPAEAQIPAGSTTPANGGEIGTLPCKASLGFSTARNLLRVTTGEVFNSTDANLNNMPSVGPTAINQRLQAAAFDTTVAPPYTTYSIVYLPSTFSVKAFFRTAAGNFDGSPGLTFAASTRIPSMQNKTTTGNAVTGAALAAGKHFVCCVYNGASSAMYIDDMTTPYATGTTDTNALSTVTYGSFGSAPPAFTRGLEIVTKTADTLAQRQAMSTWFHDASRYGT